MYIKLDDIIPNRFQPREVFDEEALNKLADSIKQHGVIEPILVRPVSNKYEIVAGERRYKASVMAGLTKIPAMVRPLSDKECAILAFVENKHRSDVSAIEEARTMEIIIHNNNMTQEELAKEIGVDQSTIANKLRLLNLPIEVQEALMHNEISERHARSLLSVKDEEKQIELLRKIKENKMTVRELDSEIKNMNGNNQNELNFMNSNPSMPREQNVEPSFMNFLNNNETKPTQEFTKPAIDDDFMKYLNSYDANNSLPEEKSVPSTPVNPMPQNDYMEINPSVPKVEPDYMSYLNTPPATESPAPVVENVAPVVDDINSSPVEEVKPDDDPAFMNFLNSFDVNNPLPEPVEEAPVASPTPDYNNYLNDNNVNPPVSEVINNPLPPVNNDFDSYLNDYNTATSAPPVAPPTVPESVSNNVVINEVNPPITDFSNQYVENSANYVDVSKQDKITSVDTVLDKIGAVVKEIKEKSIFKIDTEEINYDDIYQITIKVDKRDFE